MQFRFKWAGPILVTLSLYGCAQISPSGTVSTYNQVQFQFTPSQTFAISTVEPIATLTLPATNTPTPVALTTPIASDQFGDKYISLLPIQDHDDLSGEEIAQQLILQWLDHYKNDCQDPYYRLNAFSIKAITAEKGYLGYEWIAWTQLDILPYQPLTSNYKGKTSPNGWIGLQGEIAPDGTMRTGVVWGVFRDGDFYRLRMLIGWGT